MALKHKLPRIALRIRDGSDTPAQVAAWIRAHSTVASGYAACNTLAARVAALSDATIESVHVIYQASEEPRPIAPSSAAIDRHGTFVFQTADNSYYVASLPSIRLALLSTVEPGVGLLIPLDQSDVVAFAAALGAAACSPTGAALLAPSAGFLQYRP